jgi:nucleoside-diphosphate-sugar epimerase
VVRNSELDCAIVRPPAVYGPGDRETLELFRWARRGLMMLPPPGKLSIIHADDLADLLLKLAEEGAPTGLFEPEDSSGAITHHQLAAALGTAVGRKPLALSMPAFALRLGANLDERLRSGNAKLTRDRASYFCHPDWTAEASRRVPNQFWSPAIDLEQGLANTAEWYRNAGWL